MERKYKNATEILEEAKKEANLANNYSWNTICYVAMEKWATQFLDVAIENCMIMDDNHNPCITEKELEKIKEISLKLNKKTWKN